VSQPSGLSPSGRRPARYYEDQFRFAPNGVRMSELTDEQLLAYDPSRSPRPEPLPQIPDDPADKQPPS
jgi:hypothetical protein